MPSAQRHWLLLIPSLGALMHSSEFIRNCWYVAGRSADFEAALKAVKLLGEEIVIFRGAEGEPIALEDACPHRKLPLSCGNLKGSVVECGYHGLTFNGAGVCVAAPTQGDPIPKRARVWSYPVRDRYGFLWIWMGKAEPGPILNIPNFENSAWGKTALGALSIDCNYLYVTDNLLDPSHVAWVHVTSFGGAGTDTLPLDVEEIEDGVIVSRWIYTAPAPPYYASMLPYADNCDRKQHYECRVPATAINMSVYTRSGTGGAGQNTAR